jgi:hypothetical protein
VSTFPASSLSRSRSAVSVARSRAFIASGRSTVTTATPPSCRMEIS